MSAVNIVIHPHSPEKYVELFQSIRRARTPAKIRGEYHAMLGSARPITGSDPVKGLTGEIFKFFELDEKDDWLNIVKEKRAEEEERASIRLPKDLKPHFSFFNYVFFPDSHELFFVSRYDGKSLSPLAVQRMLEELCDRQSIVQKFGDVTVTVIPEEESLKRILLIPQMKRLHIEIRKPNADTLAVSSERMMQRMERLNASKVVTELTAERGKDLELDADIVNLAEVAESNGYVKAEGYSAEDKKVMESTREHPLRQTVEYDPDVEIARDRLIAAAEELRATLRRRRRERN